jgi:hypothetical protein
MPGVDTPDNQRGVVSAQVLLAAVPAGTLIQTVGVPANTETLVVVVRQNGLSTPSLQCAGLTSNTLYTPVTSPNNGAGNPATFFLDVSATMDTEVELVLTSPGGGNGWFIYADAGVHIVTDVSKRQNLYGAQYVVPMAPSDMSGDHPPVELQFAGSFDLNNGTVIVAQPSILQRLRVFSSTVMANSAGAIAIIARASDNHAFNLAVGPSPSVMTAYPSGLALPAGTGIAAGSNSGTSNAIVYYTVETI